MTLGMLHPDESSVAGMAFLEIAYPAGKVLQAAISVSSPATRTAPTFPRRCENAISDSSLSIPEIPEELSVPLDGAGRIRPSILRFFLADNME